MAKVAAFHCLGCGKVAEHEIVVSLGRLPLGNCLISDQDLSTTDPTYPLDLAFCRYCSLLQVQEPIPTDKLIAQNLYFTSSSPSLLMHGREMAERLIKLRDLNDRSLVVEVGSNDGTLLMEFKRNGVPVLGIEPTVHSAELARKTHGVETIGELFTNDLANRLSGLGRSADILIANYVLELVPNLDDFIDGIRTLLKEGGLAILEVPYVKSMVEQCRFDGLAHLRLTWFSVTSLDNLFRNHGLVLVDAECLPEFRGGTLRVIASTSAAPASTSRVEALLHDEAKSGVTSPDLYRAFMKRIHSTRNALRRFLGDARGRERKRIAAYSAGIKASTLLNFAQLDKEFLDFVVDGNPSKQGRYVPGVRLPVYSPQKLVEDVPDYTLLLALDFAAEIIDQQSQYRQRGGRFVVPVPDFRIV